jgi:hypothetical protein
VDALAKYAKEQAEKEKLEQSLKDAQEGKE